jgi:hypothetical protein
MVAVVALLCVVSMELGRFGVCMNAIVPHGAPTPLAMATMA